MAPLTNKQGSYFGTVPKGLSINYCRMLKYDPYLNPTRERGRVHDDQRSRVEYYECMITSIVIQN